MVARARVLVDAVLDAHHALAGAQQRRAPRPDAALPLELALAFGDDHLEPREVGRERLLQRRAHRVDVVAVDDAQPFHADALERPLDRAVGVDEALLLVAAPSARACSAGVEMISCVPVADV